MAFRPRRFMRTGTPASPATMTGMHPAIRVLIIVIITGFMITGGFYVLLGGVMLSLVFHLTAGSGSRADLVRMILRMRWFLLSIMILYAWFSPGAAFVPALGRYSPSGQGILEGLLRCAVLIVILSLVHWLVNATSREQLIQGIYWLLKPLTWLGLRPQVVAVRLALVLEIVPIMQQKLKNRPRATDARVPRVQRITAHAAAVIDAALNEADRAPLVEIELATGQRPSASDWTTLSAVILVLTMLILLPV